MKISDIIKITDECKLTGVGYDEKESVCYRIAQFDNRKFGFVESRRHADGVGWERKEHRVHAGTSDQAVIKLNGYLNGDSYESQSTQEEPRKEIKKEGVAPTREGMSVGESKAYLADRGLEPLVPGGFESIRRLQAGENVFSVWAGKRID